MLILTNKKEVRTQALRRRRDLAYAECRSKSREIAAHLLSSGAFSAADCIHCYLATPTEVQTDDIIREALRQGKQVAAPTVCDGLPALSEVRTGDTFRPGLSGTLEPTSGIPVPVEAVDLWIVPGVGFGRDGSRLGRGAGYYDRLLAKARSVVIGLAFDFQVVDRVPTEPQDRFVDYIITELEVIACKGAGSGTD